MDKRLYDRKLELIDTSPAMAEALARVDAMTDEQLRALVADEHPMVVEAAEAMLARRHTAERPVG